MRRRRTFTAVNADGFEYVDENTSTDYCGQSAFEWSKLIGERYVEYYARKQEIRACIFRLSTVFARPSEGNDPGIVTHYVESIKHRLPIRLPAGVDPVRDILVRRRLLAGLAERSIKSKKLSSDFTTSEVVA